MAVSNVSTIDSENWQLIATNTPAGTSTSSTFSSLSGYRKYMVVWSGISLASSEDFYARFNGSTSFYGAGAWYGTNCSMHYSWIPLIGTYVSNVRAGYFVVEDADKAIPHRVNGAGSSAISITGMHADLAAITSIALISGANITGTIYLYGIAN